MPRIFGPVYFSGISSSSCAESVSTGDIPPSPTAPWPNWRVNKVTKIPPKKSRNLFLIKGSIKSEVAVYSGTDSAKEIKRKLQPSVIWLGSPLPWSSDDLGQSARVECEKFRFKNNTLISGGCEDELRWVLRTSILFFAFLLLVLWKRGFFV